jgi:hypothetical protein
MIDTGAGLRVRRRLLLVLLVCIALPLVGGCSSDPECIAVPFLPQCFEDDEEEKTDDTATQTRVRVNARADDMVSTFVLTAGTGLSDPAWRRSELRLIISMRTCEIR